MSPSTEETIESRIQDVRNGMQHHVDQTIEQIRIILEEKNALKRAKDNLAAEKGMLETTGDGLVPAYEELALANATLTRDLATKTAEAESAESRLKQQEQIHTGEKNALREVIDGWKKKADDFDQQLNQRSSELQTVGAARDAAAGRKSASAAELGRLRVILFERVLGHPSHIWSELQDDFLNLDLVEQRILPEWEAGSIDFGASVDAWLSTMTISTPALSPQRPEIHALQVWFRSVWNHEECLLWLRSMELLCRLYADPLSRLQEIVHDISATDINLEVAGPLVRALLELVQSLVTFPRPERAWLGRYLVDHARAHQTGFRIDYTDLIPDRTRLLVVTNGHEMETKVSVLNRNEFALFSGALGWQVRMRNHPQPGKSSIKILDVKPIETRVLVKNLLADALQRLLEGNLFW